VVIVCVHMKKTCLVLLAPGVEELEVVAPVDILRRGGIEVTIATVRESSMEVQTKGNMVLKAEKKLSDCLENTYDCLLLPGGPGVQTLLEDERVMGLVKHSFEHERYIGAICAAPIILQQAGVLKNKEYTAHFSVAEHLPNIHLNKPVIQDGNIITANGPGSAILFGLALLEAMTTRMVAEKVATDMCLTNF